MLNCHCRTAALRIFVRGITSLQVPATTLYRPCARAGNKAYLPTQRRPFAGTSRAKATQGAAAAATTDDVQSVPDEDSSSPSAAGAGGLTAGPVATGQSLPDGRLGDNTTSKSPRRSRTSSTRASRKDEGKTKNLGATSIRADRKNKPEGRTKPDRKDKDKPARRARPDGKDRSDRHKRAALKKGPFTANTATTKPPPPKKKEDWQLQRKALKAKFPEGWQPRKKLSPDALEGIRALHARFPEQYPTEVLAERFEVSAEAIRRILRSKWTPTPAEEESREERWFNRGKEVWARWAELGKKPPQRWRREGVVRKPYWNERKKERRMEHENRRRRDGGDGGGSGSGAGTERSRLAQNLI